MKQIIIIFLVPNLIFLFYLYFFYFLFLIYFIFFFLLYLIVIGADLTLNWCRNDCLQWCWIDFVPRWLDTSCQLLKRLPKTDMLVGKQLGFYTVEGHHRMAHLLLWGMAKHVTKKWSNLFAVSSNASQQLVTDRFCF